ncbi:MAG: alanyl-tRNA editing protein, partial [Alicyclobacillus sp.]|nr:alanyl-tRNA editing protein [Alicyclobacillus sp.]
MHLRDKRLYYEHSFLSEFSAVVGEQREEDGRWSVRLDRTAFYPTSGGQAHDTGWLGDRRVLDVRVDAGDVVHV